MTERARIRQSELDTDFEQQIIVDEIFVISGIIKVDNNNNNNNNNNTLFHPIIYKK